MGSAVLLVVVAILSREAASIGSLLAGVVLFAV
jgi:hypothetical protein